jgi:hypothetical protein
VLGEAFNQFAKQRFGHHYIPLEGQSLWRELERFGFTISRETDRKGDKLSLPVIESNATSVNDAGQTYRGPQLQMARTRYLNVPPIDKLGTLVETALGVDDDA